MTTDKLFVLSDLFLALGGLLASLAWIGFAIYDPTFQAYQHARWLPLNSLVIAGGLFMAIGTLGFYLRQASQAGSWGLIGFGLLFIGILIAYTTVQSIQTVTMPNVPQEMMYFVSVAAPAAFFGIIITGFVTVRAGVYPPAFGVALILSALLGLLTRIISLPPWLINLISATFTISMMYMGIWLLGKR